MYINILSHKLPARHEWAIQGLFRDFADSLQSGQYAIGLHPWYIEKDTWENEFSMLQELSQQNKVLAIGECGLDTLCKTDKKLQELVFISQLLWANEIQKPLIIHCVRAFEDVLHLLKHHAVTVPVIFHGYNRNVLLAKRILEEGYWLSFGKALLQPQMRTIFHSIPLEKCFLETSDSDYTIETIYKAAAAIRNISTEELHLQLVKNRQAVFHF